MQLVLQSTARAKDSQKPLKDPLAMYQKQDLGLNKLIKQCWTLKPFLNPHWYFESILSKNTESWLYKHLPKTFDKFDNMLIGLYFSLFVRSCFLKTGVTTTSFISDGNLTNSNDLFNSWCKIGLKMSILSLTILVGMSEFGEDLQDSGLFNAFLFQYVLCFWSRRYYFYFHNGI